MGGTIVGLYLLVLLLLTHDATCHAYVFHLALVLLRVIRADGATNLWHSIHQLR